MYKTVLTKLKYRLIEFMDAANTVSNNNDDQFNSGRYAAYNHALQLLELYLVQEILYEDFYLTDENNSVQLSNKRLNK